MGVEFDWKRHSIAIAGKDSLEEDARTFSFRCAPLSKLPFTRNAPELSRLLFADARRGDGKRFVVRRMKC
jgi:hypothetical protein